MKAVRERRRQSLTKEQLKLLERVKSCNEGGQLVLDLSKLELLCVPEECSPFGGLRELVLKKNNLSSLETVLQFQYVEKLDISFNSLGGALFGVSGLEHLSLLKSLNLSGNGLTEVPDGVLQLSLLQELNLSRNSITIIPDGVGTGLVALTALNVAHNRIALLPASLEGAKALHVLNVEGNPCANAIPIGTRIEFLVEKRRLMASKDQRRDLVRRSMKVQQHVVGIEKDHAVADYAATALA